MIFATPNDCLNDDYHAFRKKYNLTLNRESEERIHKGFALAQAQLTDLFG